MEWRLMIHKRSIKFLNELDKGERDRVTETLQELLMNLEHGTIPFRNMDIKKLRGKWEGFFRIRIGNIRIILKIDTANKTVYVYNIHYRGRVYK
jgi:mRNA interferase RelE/StbE